MLVKLNKKGEKLVISVGPNGKVSLTLGLLSKMYTKKCDR